MSQSTSGHHYVYVDNSNLFIEGQRVSAVRKGHARTIVEAMNTGILDFNWNVDYGRLYGIVCGDRSAVASARLWGSPPPHDSFWVMVKREGWDVTLFNRNAAGKEKQVDTDITYRMTKDAYTVMDRKSSEITLVAGDKDYASAVADLVTEGFRVDVAFWGHAARELRESATRFVSLDQYIGVVGRARRAPPNAA